MVLVRLVMLINDQEIEVPRIYISVCSVSVADYICLLQLNYRHVFFNAIFFQLYFYFFSHRMCVGRWNAMEVHRNEFVRPKSSTNYAVARVKPVFARGRKKTSKHVHVPRTPRVWFKYQEGGNNYVVSPHLLTVETSAKCPGTTTSSP